jgi:hypothetical protein
MAVLFAVLGLGLIAIAVAAIGSGGPVVVTIGAGALGGWMLSLAASAVRRRR